MKIGLFAQGKLTNFNNILRLLQPYMELKRRYGVEVHIFSIPYTQEDWETFKTLDTVVFRRMFVPSLMILLMNIFRESGSTIIWDIDDCIWKMPESNPYRGEYLLDDFYYKWLGSKADIVTVASRKMENMLSPNVRDICFVPNHVSVEDWSENTKKPDISVPGIGFAGTASHVPDFDFLVPVIVELINEFPSIPWKFYGACPTALQNMDTVTYCPEPDDQQPMYEFHRKWSSGPFSVGLAPLKDDTFNSSKSSLKFLDYTYHGAVGVYSDISTYNSDVIHGHNGMLAGNDPDKWYSAIRHLIENPDDIYAMYARAMSTVEENFILEKSSYIDELYNAVVNADKKHVGSNGTRFTERFFSASKIGIYGAGNLGRFLHQVFSERFGKKPVFITSTGEPGTETPESASGFVDYTVIGSIDNYCDMARKLESLGMAAGEDYI